MGGWSAEREISLVSGKAVSKCLLNKGYEAKAIDVDHNIGEILTDFQPDVVFNALHGRFGEDGCTQGMLEMMGFPYTHSGVLASALAMDKSVSRHLFTENKIPCPPGLLASREDVLEGNVFEPPYIVKPVNEGSSVGVVMVSDETENVFNIEKWEYADQLLVEQFIPGRELSVAVKGGESLGVIEILSSKRFYDYEAKYSQGGSSHFMPAQIPNSVYELCMDYAERAHRCLGCRGVTRSDFRWNEDDRDSDGVFLLEINTQPGMTPTSLVPEIAEHVGVSFGDLIEWMVEDASCRR